MRIACTGADAAVASLEGSISPPTKQHHWRPAELTKPSFVSSVGATHRPLSPLPKSSPKDIKIEIFPLKIKLLHLYKINGTKSIIFRGARIH